MSLAERTDVGLPIAFPRDRVEVKGCRVRGQCRRKRGLSGAGVAEDDDTHAAASAAARMLPVHDLAHPVQRDVHLGQPDGRTSPTIEQEHLPSGLDETRSTPSAGCPRGGFAGGLRPVVAVPTPSAGSCPPHQRRQISRASAALDVSHPLARPAQAAGYQAPGVRPTPTGEGHRYRCWPPP